jgi:hypothetical protein
LGSKNCLFDLIGVAKVTWLIFCFFEGREREREKRERERREREREREREAHV